MSVELDKIKDLEKQISYLQSKNAYYEQDGIGKLYHALNRKANEMAELLNKTSLTAIDIDDPKIKTFERLQKIWVDAGTISASIKALEVLAGINQEVISDKKEAVQVNKKPFSPENMADAVGELAGKRI
jgi:HEPN domain-containing protein